MEVYVVGAAAGMLACAVMYALLYPVARGRPLPPDAFAARILRIEPARARIPGMVLQLAFGAFWGAALGLVVDQGLVPGATPPIAGLLVGVAAFLTSLGGFTSVGIIRHHPDWREWTGHFLNHLVFGLTAGLVLLAVMPRL